jgi:hypothetical protein
MGGALDPNSDRAEQHAERYYDSVRKMSADVQSISKNTGFTVEEIESIKNHVFLKEHNLGEDGIRRFHPSYDMAQSWQRLIDGKNIKPHDIVLLKHELLEIDFMKQGYSQDNAHNMTNLTFNYKKALKEWGKL